MTPSVFASGGYRLPTRDFDKWQIKSGINPDLHERFSDHLQPGDLIRIYAINRASGYVGHTETIVKPAGREGGPRLSFQIDPIVMGPPNLKVLVERGYDIKAGLEKGEVREDQIIGFEGASLTSDKYVKITTKWLDHAGRPMPDSMNGAGYTGRVAILSGDKTLPNDSQGVYQFAVEPGENLQVLQLPNALTDAQHFYVHINGEPESGNPIFTGTDNARHGTADFGSSGKNPGILEKRPDKYVPFMVRVFDEISTEAQKQFYAKIQRENPSLFKTLESPQAIYRWLYRPEMQFSAYKFAIKEINRSRDNNGDGTIQDSEVENILNESSPLITSDSVIDLLYNLTTTNLIPLDFLNAGESKELIFTLGEQEIKAVLGDDQTLKFEDIQHLAFLSPEDYLTLRLYTNNDMGNALWEWAFTLIEVSPKEAEVSVDSNELDIVAYLPSEVKDEEPKSVTIKWTITDGSGSFENATTTSTIGVFSNTLIFPTTDDESIEAEIEVTASDDPRYPVGNKRKMGPYNTRAGAPERIEIESASMSLPADGVSTTQITATVYDQYDNESRR